MEFARVGNVTGIAGAVRTLDVPSDLPGLVPGYFNGNLARGRVQREGDDGQRHQKLTYPRQRTTATGRV